MWGMKENIIVSPTFATMLRRSAEPACTESIAAVPVSNAGGVGHHGSVDCEKPNFIPTTEIKTTPRPPVAEALVPSREIWRSRRVVESTGRVPDQKRVAPQSSASSLDSSACGELSEASSSGVYSPIFNRGRFPYLLCHRQRKQSLCVRGAGSAPRGRGPHAAHGLRGVPPRPAGEARRRRVLRPCVLRRVRTPRACLLI
ncbi:hypothetical protein DFH07DRAFT_847720 [Mycena maculata]|uniref:Uncharacterized protein n=1 Tax=Mycena maculata TaxID=230809 RepID=A0AAD7HZY8_9AGAR|nr:hypothetical protein DFH07DRAFT_847720 [Mycena maculata]